MIWIDFNKYSSISGKFFIAERYYFKGRWTPFCKIRLRYFKILREMKKNISPPIISPIRFCSVLPMEIINESGKVSETIICDSVSGNRGRKDRMPVELTLVRTEKGKIMRGRYAIKDIEVERNNAKKDRLSAAEALFGFCSWLTTREEATIMSKYHEVSPMVELIKLFCERQGFDEPREDWCDSLLSMKDVTVEKAIKPKTEDLPSNVL